MPLFATGHARFRLDQAVRTMAEALRDAETTLGEVVIVVRDEERRAAVRAILEQVVGAERLSG